MDHTSAPSESLRVLTLAERPSLAQRLHTLEDDSFPSYLNEEETWLSTRERILSSFARYHVAVVDGDEHLAGICVNVPLCWTGQVSDLPGYNELLLRCLEEHEAGKAPTALCAILGAVAPEYRSRGIAGRMLEIVCRMLSPRGIRWYLSPVRPAIKHLYPTFGIDEYLAWRLPDNRLIDPWLNSFLEDGAKILGVARDAITITAPIARWSEWTKMAFPVSGTYVIPGGHRPLVVSLETGLARYAEDHVWYCINDVGGE